MSAPKLSRKKLWAFRLVAAIGLPLIFFLVVELLLRLTGFGYPTSFLLPEKIGEQNMLISNRQFGWRFFGPQQARAPQALAIARTKSPDTIRVFVFGESAAFGDPQPDFGLPRMLHALLSERYPDTRFEVINAAMTAINSHVVLPIARDCAKANGDIWVVYLGNNEVVGPFGAGTVFGSQTPPLATIRAKLALKATRTGQLLDGVLRRVNKPPADKTEWGGMLMFLENQVPWADARLERMYRHFERNLSDIIRAGRTAGAAVVVSTVAVNLKDSAPFSSALPPEKIRTRWQELFHHGVTAQAAGNFAAALEWFQQAEKIAPGVAELHFREGECFLALNDHTKAQEAFSRTRDFDTLRFRCDSRLNAITRRVAGGPEPERVTLVDAEAEFARHSPAGLPGADWFYEHVHLTFQGNYLLARKIAESIDPLLPAQVRRQPNQQREWATIEQCALRLAWTAWNQREALSEIIARLNDPPFTHQSNHQWQLDRIGTQMKTLLTTPVAIQRRDAEASCIAALKITPDDPAILGRLADLWESTGNLTNAAIAAQRVTELLPHGAEGWSRRGVILARLDRSEEAVALFRECLRRDPENVFTRNSLAQVLVRLNRMAEARRAYEEAITLNPAYGTAHLGLGRLLEGAGQTEAAERHYAQARQLRVNRPADLEMLARFCHTKGWLADAAKNYALALQLNPGDVALRLEAGRCATTLKRHEVAKVYYTEAVALAPDFGEAHFLLGRELGRAGDPAGAEQHFGIAVRLLPELVEARLNHGIALMNLGRGAESAAEFEAVLQRQPTNTLARQYLSRVRGETIP